jgi:PEP-CTERM motif
VNSALTAHEIENKGVIVMKMRTKLMGAAAALLMSATPALATTITITSAPYSPGAVFGGISVLNAVPPNPTSFGGEAGRFAVSGFEVGNPTNTFNAFTYCIDVFKAVFTSTNYDIAPLSAIGASAERQGLLAGLLVNSNTLFGAATTDAQRSLIAAATQVSVWELVYETAGTPLTVSSGNFSVFGDFVPAVSTLANSYLANNWTASPTLVSSLISVGGQSQNQIYLNTPAVPEPATWLSMILGFGIVGRLLRRAKTRTLALG